MYSKMKYKKFTWKSGVTVLLNISEGSVRIIDRLEAAGFTAYITGGAIRDLIMGKTPHDYDIATSAKAQQVKSLFSRTIDTGIKHGTVTVIDNKIGYEVTTYREESTYSDRRHPDEVKFVNDIRDDLARRDFTINALAYNPRRGLIDNYDGVKDIQKKLIRCVGDASCRFREDALRMLRAVRFSATLEFEIDNESKQAIRKFGVLIKKISSERIREELNKILLSKNPEKIYILHELGLMQHIIPELETCFSVPQKNKYHIYDVGHHIIAALSNTPKDLVIRWATLLHDIGKPLCLSTDSNGIIHFYGHHRESVKIAKDIMHRLRFDTDSINNISILIENHDVRVEPTPPAVKRMLARTGEELFEKLLILQEADNRGKNPKYIDDKIEKLNNVRKIYHEIIAEGQPYKLSDLVINGRDLIKMGVRAGREIGDTLKVLLDEVVINPELNDREYLLKRARQLKNRKGRTY